MKTPETHTPHSRGLLALSPIAVLLAVYLVGSLIAGDF